MATKRLYLLWFRQTNPLTLIIIILNINMGLYIFQKLESFLSIMISHQTSVSKSMPPEIVNVLMFIMPPTWQWPGHKVLPLYVHVCSYACHSMHMSVRYTKLNGFDQYVMKVNTLYITIITSTSMIIVYISPCLQELWPFVHENSQFLMV